MAIPEFILRKLFVRESLTVAADSFSFVLRNTFAPGTLTGLVLEVDGRPVPLADLTLQAGTESPRGADTITPEAPFPLAVGVDVRVRVQGVPLGQGRLALRAETREAGLLAFTVQAEGGPTTSAAPVRRGWRLPRLFRRPLRAEVTVDAEAVSGEIHPYVYGQFVEHLERCVYDGIWTADGVRLREDTLALIRALRPPVTRYPGGNFASGYHWEDGIGPVAQRPARYDAAWQATESNRVGTDEFMAFCAAVGTAPFLVVNDGSGTPEEAARWVAYCNEPPTTEQGRRRAANGHPEPYGVKLWGIGNEVWGRWQIGHTGPAEYVARLRAFAQAMRAVDPTLQLVAVGDGPLTDAPDDPARLWNETVLRAAGAEIDYLSFHIYQPGEEGWQEQYDPEALHHTVCAAPLDVETIVGRMAAQLAVVAPQRRIRVALDEWNLWLAPPPDAVTMHRLRYTLRDALYVAGMLNSFHRCSPTLGLANLAQLVNVLPLIVTDERRAYATPLYYPFVLYQAMEALALKVETTGPTFNSTGLGRTIAPHHDVPYLDVTATRDPAGQRVVLGCVNRHPTEPLAVTLRLRGGGWRPVQARALTGPEPLAVNDFDAPERVGIHEAPLPTGHGDRFTWQLPPASVTVLTLG